MAGRGSGLVTLEPGQCCPLKSARSLCSQLLCELGLHACCERTFDRGKHSAHEAQVRGPILTAKQFLITFHLLLV